MTAAQIAEEFGTNFATAYSLLGRMHERGLVRPVADADNQPRWVLTTDGHIVCDLACSVVCKSHHIATLRRTIEELEVIAQSSAREITILNMELEELVRAPQ